MKNSDAVVRYWRKSLSDESYAHITIGEGTRDGFLLQDGTAGDWKVHKDVLAGINHPDGGSFVLGIGALTRATGRESMRTIMPILMVPVEVNRKGDIVPDFNAGGPWLQRALFFRPFSFADSEKVEWKVSTYPLVGNAGDKPVQDLPWENRWQVAMPMVDKLVRVISGGVAGWSADNGESFVRDMVGKVPEGWVAEKSVFFIPAQAYEINRTRMTGPLLVAYDHLIEKMAGGKPPLLIDNFARTEDHVKRQAQPLGDEDRLFAMQSHIAQVGDRFPLDDDQRRAAQTTAVMETGDILAIEGPPGTGKTALIQALVADVTVNAVLRTPDMPGKVLISSANNQAIENVLEVFAKAGGYNKDIAVLTQRWLPSVGSVGLHLAAYGRVTGNDTTMWKWPTYFPGQDSITTISAMRDDFLSGVTWDTYRMMFAKHFGDRPDSAESAAKTIHAEIIAISGEIKEKIGKFRNLQNLLDKAWSLKERRGYEIGCETAWRERLRAAKAVYDDVMAKESTTMMRMRLAVPGQKQKREEEKNAILKEAGIPSTWENIEAWMRALAGEIKEASVTSAVLAEFFGHGTRLTSAGRTAAGTPAARELDQRLDTTMRPTLFWLAVHYWEARWIHEMSMRKPNTRGQIPGWDYASDRAMSEDGWNLRFMAFPVMVSTLYSAPKFFSTRDKEPLVEAVDLVIIDEGGQASPELALPTVAIGKKLVVMGDESQTEPIWAMSEDMDKENAATSEITGYRDYNELRDAGISAYGTSIQARAYAADTTGHKRLDDAGKVAGAGITLTNHRRSCAPIMEVFNRISYQGRLRCAREMNERALQSGLHPLQYMHVPAFSKKVGESRVNEVEARAIAAWVSVWRENLLKIYDAHGLEQILGIVTPYAAQAVTISNALRQFGVDDRVTVGTIHKLQGAEREVIIFSPTVGYGDSPAFFDGAANMINVATSRAKDALVLIGNLDMTPAAPTIYSRTVAYMAEHGEEIFIPGVVQKNLENLDGYQFGQIDMGWGRDLAGQYAEMISGVEATRIQIVLSHEEDLHLWASGTAPFAAVVEAIEQRNADVTVWARAEWHVKERLAFPDHQGNVSVKLWYAPYSGSMLVAGSEHVTCAAAGPGFMKGVSEEGKRAPWMFYCGAAVRRMFKS